MRKGGLFVRQVCSVHRSTLRIWNCSRMRSQSRPRNAKNGSGRIRIDKAASIHQEVNLIGMTVDEAMPVLNKYLDDAYLAHMSQVTVIHGRGTGALRKAVHQQLAKLKYVKS